ncbi:membrane protein [Salmonella enterica subsp. salamae]|nr:membrane protein [Salmonella enterica subsp. salamae]
MPPLKKIVLLLFVGAMLAMVTTPALALMCLASHSAKECAVACAVDMWFMFPICF